MREFISVLRESAKELKKPRTTTMIAMLVAIYVILHFFLSIQITPLMRISVSMVTIMIAAAWLGPVPAAMVGVLGDLLAFLIKPTGAFHPGWTLNGLIIGLIYGFFLYKKTRKQPEFTIRIMIAKLIICLVVELVLTPLWLAQLYGNAYELIVSTRIIKTVLSYPLDILLGAIVISALNRTQLVRAFNKE